MLRQSLPMFIQLCFIEHFVGNYLVANGIDERQEMRATIVAKGWRFDRHFCLNVFYASGLQEDWKSSANITIATARVKDCMKSVQQYVPRRMRRLAEPRNIVHVLKRYRSTRAKQGKHFRKKRFASGYIYQYQSLMH